MSERHLDSFSEVALDILDRLFGIDTHQLMLILNSHVMHECSVVVQLLLDVSVLILILVNKSTKDRLVLNVLIQDIVILVGHWVKASLLQLLIDQVVTHVKGKD